MEDLASTSTFNQYTERRRQLSTNVGLYDYGNTDLMLNNHIPTTNDAVRDDVNEMIFKQNAIFFVFSITTAVIILSGSYVYMKGASSS